jgi:hypothetical protein
MRWEVISDPFLGNGSVNTFLRKRVEHYNTVTMEAGVFSM